ncbi:hypothetical protein HUU62_08630 [Rhodoferax sp. 4810]|uniref:Carboxypeptidase regulatory-like domain-containing protein n=1 Tax=Thiospirillum jenense TaxID=1653858 RepID=A0A839H9K1_9GAMM|nr:hypothetical protein [Thiospirillum jenense]MBB1074474.1 hypothetical protein [Rhodoferax jenense]MBB1125544.1 hypothetical protein [Thiospirillum jenense]
MSGRVFHSPIRRDMFYGGRHKIVGTTDELGVRGAYRVRLYHQPSGQLVQQTRSNENGDFQFDWINSDLYFCVAHDHGDEPVNGALRDYVTPEDRDNE